MTRPRKTRIADGAPRRWYIEPEPDRDYLALATYFEVRSIRHLPRFEWYTLRVHRQLARSPGLVGYSFRAKFPTRYWTLSAWQDNRQLLAFMRASPHGKVMVVLKPTMAGFGAVRWQASGYALPLAWSEGLERLDAAEPGPPPSRAS